MLQKFVNNNDLQLEGGVCKRLPRGQGFAQQNMWVSFTFRNKTLIGYDGISSPMMSSSIVYICLLTVFVGHIIAGRILAKI